MVTIAQILTWPHDAVVDSVQLLITNVYPPKSGTSDKGPWTRQNFSAKDIAGTEIRGTVWNHADIKVLEGKNVVLSSTKGGHGKLTGVSVKHGEWTPKTGVNAGKLTKTVELDVSKSGNFQFVEVWKAQNAGTPQAATETGQGSPQNGNEGQSGQKAAEGSKGQINPINGAKVGMALNNTVNLLVAQGGFDVNHPDFYKELTYHASRFIEVSNWLEAGHVLPKRD